MDKAKMQMQMQPKRWGQLRKGGKAGKSWEKLEKRAEKWKCDRVYYVKKPLLKLLAIKYLLIRMMKAKFDDGI